MQIWIIVRRQGQNLEVKASARMVTKPADKHMPMANQKQEGHKH